MRSSGQMVDRERWRRLALAGLMGLGVVGSQPALAYEQATVESGVHARWYEVEIVYTIDEDAMETEGIGKKVMGAAVQAAFDAWLQVMCTVCHDPASPACAPVSCSSHPLGLSARFDGFAAKAPMGPGCEGGFQPDRPDRPDSACVGITEPAPACKLVPNGNQIIVVRDPAKWCFASGVVAMTLVSASQVSGEIADADVLLNAAHRTWCTGTCGSTDYDLQNTLTHEVGHLLGLDHSALPDATMFGGAPPQELIKRDLDADDASGICQNYRQVYQQGGCPEVEEPGCCTWGGWHSPPLGTALMVMFAFLIASRRRSVAAGR